MSIEVSKLSDAFTESVPAHQTALDIFSGEWFSKMPLGSNLVAGHAEHFTDARVTWAAPLIGGIEGKRVLELGPFEAYNSFQFDRMGASEVVSIESSARNFVKCLIIKNIFSMKTMFMHGDFNLYTPPQEGHFDVVWASGVLYHLTKPIEFLEKISRWSDIMFVWTQYFDEKILTTDHPHSENFDSAQNVTVEYAGRPMNLHWRSYLEPNSGGKFSGGSEEYSFWMELDDIFHVLNSQGFKRIEMGVNNIHHGPGPACFFLAFRE